MGGGHWDSKLYMTASSVRADSGTKDFAYSDTVMSAPRHERKVHEDLDPAKIKDGVNHVRESHDSEDHPESRAIAVLFDVTGSMRYVPEVFQKNLNKLMSLLVLKGKIEHPQVLVGGIGDATCDRVPLQISQFESDNRIDEHIRKIILEGGGGGQKYESYGLALYAITRLTDIDCYNKRGQKGYLFLAGDEMPYPVITKDEIKKILDAGEEADVLLEDVLEEVKKKYEVFFIFPTHTQYEGDKEVHDTWTKYLPERVLHLEDPKDICELITSTVASTEGIEMAEIMENLKKVGVSDKTRKSVEKTLTAVK